MTLNAFLDTRPGSQVISQTFSDPICGDGICDEPHEYVPPRVREWERERNTERKKERKRKRERRGESNRERKPIGRPAQSERAGEREKHSETERK